jgi:CheY-like chemotaxis protein
MDSGATPFTAMVRIGLALVGMALAASGAASVFLTENAAGSAALITLGSGLAVLAVVGPHVEAFTLGGMEATFRRTAAADALQDAIEAAAKAAGIRVSEGDKSGALRRAEAHTSLLRKGSVLWVDDDPGRIDAERRMLNAFGVSVDIALDNVDGMSKISRRHYDCIISDIDRGTELESGLELARRMTGTMRRWLIYYIADYDPSLGTPAHALGITNRPDHLLHYVLDAIERERFEPGAGSVN